MRSGIRQDGGPDVVAGAGPGAARWWEAMPAAWGLVDLAYVTSVGAARHPVVPDGRAAIVWSADGALRLCGPVTRSWRPDRSGIEVTGVRLALGAMPVVTGVPARTLVNRRVPLDEVWPGHTGELAGALDRAEGPVERVALLQRAVLAHRAPGSVVDPVIPELVGHLGPGRRRVAEAAALIGLSERQLRRRSDEALGYPPSVLARLVRFRRFLAHLRAADADAGASRLADLACDAGYADHAHLTRDCRAITGLLPSALEAGVRGATAG